ncbi:hypothetical protein Lal_00034867 [Lupinus albus]|nr:hypothetical protein Lal_00034867 [Lupinus albus]
MRIDECLALNVNSQGNSSFRSFNGNRGRGTNSFRGKGRLPYNAGTRSSGGRFCTHCERTNHTVDTCFLKHGYPPGYHYTRAGRSANVVNTFPVEFTHDQTNEQFSNENYVAENVQNNQGFTNDQVKCILELLERTKGDNSKVMRQ